MQIRPHQMEGADFLAARDTAYLNWEPRVGKTFAAIRACDRVLAKRVLVLCPSIVKSNWKTQFEALQREPRTVGVATGLNGWPETDVVIANYDLVSKETSAAIRQIPRVAWDVVILDEAHFLKGPTRRTRNVLGKRMDRGSSSLIRLAKRVWCLSGTPCPNHYGELFPVLKALYPAALLDKRAKSPRSFTLWEFQDRFCTHRTSNFGRTITGSDTNMARDLMGRVAPFMNHKKLKDVAKDIPKVEMSDMVFSADELTNADRKKLGDLDELMKRELDQMLVESGDELISAVNSAGMHIARERQAVGLLKAGLAAQLADYELYTGQYRKLVIFHHHKAVGQVLSDLLVAHGCVWVHGGISQPVRELRVKTFRESPSVKIFIAQINAANTGIDLSVSDDVLIVEPSWVPADNEQAINRVVNITKSSPTFARFVVLAGTMDERITKAIASKMAGLNALFGA